MLLRDLTTPRLGLVNPDTCRVCCSLRTGLTEALEAGDAEAGEAVVIGMYLHVQRGHPDDPRTVVDRSRAVTPRPAV